MIAKMEAFTDAGLYEQDEFIDFLPEGHVYLYRGQYQLLPVSNLVGYFFEPFDGQSAALRRQQRYGIPAETTLREWKRIGCMASEVGTFLHEQTENYFKNGRFDTRYVGMAIRALKISARFQTNSRVWVAPTYAVRENSTR